MTTASDTGVGQAVLNGRSSTPEPSATVLRSTNSDPSAIPGHIGIAPRALNRVATAIVAETLGVPLGDVRVDTGDDAGNVAFRVATPIAIPVLSSDPSVVRPVGGVLGTVLSLQETVRRRIGEIAGRTVSRVDVTVTGSTIVTKGRELK